MKTNGAAPTKGNETFWDVKSAIEKGRKSAVVRLKRKLFEDPLLTVFFIRGDMILANSFVENTPWHRGVLSEEDLERGKENLLAYAFSIHGDKLFTHLRQYTKRVVEKVLEEAQRNGWEYEINVEELNERRIREIFGSGKSLSFKPIKRNFNVLLTELSTLGVISALFLEKDVVIGPESSFSQRLKELHSRLLDMGIMGHYMLFFPGKAMVHGDIKGHEFLGEVEYTPQTDRVFPFVKKDILTVPNILQEFSWDSKLERPFGIYVRYKGRGVLICLRAEGPLVYVGRLALMSPAEVLKMIEKYRSSIAEAVRAVKSKGRMPGSLLEIKVKSFLKQYPNPKDFAKVLKKEFGI
ncbi:MAG: hypothetical protein GXO39_03700 [Thermotogae bacterium]|nr:hypothetical protein [Thermotogota bacterium]